jgi:hypothetical protein
MLGNMLIVSSSFQPKYFNATSQTYHSTSKQAGLTHTRESVSLFIEQFFANTSPNAESPVRLQVVNAVRRRLEQFAAFFEHQTDALFICTSLLTVYDAEPELYAPLARVAMIDLSHVYFERHEPDTGYLTGLRSLDGILADLS